MGAGVHHDDAVAGKEQDARVFENAHAIIRHAVKDQYPIAVGVRGTHFPSSKEDVVRCANIVFFVTRANLRESGIGLPDEVGCELPADRMEKRGPEKPSAHGSQCGREEEQDQKDANEPAAHGGPIKILERRQHSSGATRGMERAGTLPPCFS